MGMNHTPRSRWVRSLGSTRLTLIMLAVFAVAIAAATFLEVRYGTEGARALVYNARWFEILLALLVLNLIVSLIVHFPYHVRQTGFVITHTGFIVVLVAAGITRFVGYEGNMPIREGSSTDYLYSSKDYIAVSVNGASAAFPVRLYKPGKNSLKRRLSAGGEQIHVSVEEYFPHYQTQFVKAPGGRPALLYTVVGMKRGQQEMLLLGDDFESQGVAVHFMEGDRAIAGSMSEYGDLIVYVGDEVKRLAVTGDLSGRLEIGGYRFRIKELAPSFQVGRESLPTDPMTNPAIRVEVEAPEGEKGERLLFAYHPDFDTGHSGKQALFEDINMVYKFERNLFLSRADGALLGQADFALLIDRHGSGAHDSTAVAAGEKFVVEPGAVVRAGAFGFVVNEVWETAVEKMVSSSNSDLPAAVRIALEGSGGKRAEVFVPRFADAANVDLGGQTVQVTYGPRLIDLPYRLYLDDFVLITYPGSDNPASFESHVKIYDEERGVNGQPVRIYMNHPLAYRGFKHFQSSYDRDRLGTVLSVNHDPGKLPTYFGYVLVGVGFLITLTRGIWYRPAAARRTT